MTDENKEFAFTVSVAELRDIVGILLHHLVQQGYDVVRIPETYYWNIPTAQLYDPQSTPTDLDLGDVYDDWQELVKIRDKPDLAVTDAFAWLGAVCRAIGDHTVG